MKLETYTKMRKIFSSLVFKLTGGKEFFRDPSHLVHPMKWFFAYSEDSNPRMPDLIKVAVITAQKQTNLVPYCIYDGKPSKDTAWLEKKGVHIIYHRSLLSETVTKIFGEGSHAKGGRGALLRVDLPKLLVEQGFTDPYVLYTDCDVMFMDSIHELQKIRPRYFACAPDAEPDNWNNINTGVMLMNVKNLYSTYEEFVLFIKNNMKKDWAFDQNAYNIYYKGKITKLPIEYNWKPYWGDSPSKKIIHFHGPKPIYGENYDTLKGTEHEPLLYLYDKDRNTYQKFFKEWNEILLRGTQNFFI